jgi:SprT protein
MEISKTHNNPQRADLGVLHSALGESFHEAKITRAALEFYSRMGERHPAIIRLDLKGRAAGQWRWINGQEILRFNAEAFRKDWHAHFPATVAHEVAHSIVYRRFGLRTVKPHGPEWRDIMRILGHPPDVTHRTPLRGRRSRLYLYRCACQEHRLGPRRHSLLRKGTHRYHCSRCGTRLNFLDRFEWRE